MNIGPRTGRVASVAAAETAAAETAAAQEIGSTTGGESEAEQRPLQTKKRGSDKCLTLWKNGGYLLSHPCEAVPSA